MFAFDRFTRRSIVGGARKHGVFRRHPPLPLVTEKRRDLLLDGSGPPPERIFEKERRINTLNEAISAYLAQISRRTASAQQQRMIRDLHHIIADVERVGDHGENILELAIYSRENALSYSDAAVAELRRRGVEPWFVVDEGGAIAAEAFPGVVAPIGVIGLTEKGVTSLELRVEGRGGHASTPVRNGPTARIARATGSTRTASSR